MKLDANRIAEIAISATEMVAWRVEAWTELFWRFFIIRISREQFYRRRHISVNIFLTIIAVTLVFMVFATFNGSINRLDRLLLREATGLWDCL